MRKSYGMIKVMVLMSALTSLICISVCNAETAEEWYKKGNELKDLGKYSEAITAYDKAIELVPTNYHAYNERGSCHLFVGNKGNAENDMTKALQLAPQGEKPFMLVNRANVYIQTAKFDKAVDDLTVAIQISDKNFFAYMARGDAYRSLKKLEQAISDYSRALEVADKKSIEAWGRYIYSKRAKTYFDLRKFQEGVNDVVIAAQLGDEESQKILENLEKKGLIKKKPLPE